MALESPAELRNLVIVVVVYGIVGDLLLKESCQIIVGLQLIALTEKGWVLAVNSTTTTPFPSPSLPHTPDLVSSSTTWE